MVEDEVIAQQLEALVTPAISAQEKYYRQLGLRDRILNLPFMVAAVLTLLWRDVAGVTELTRMLAREGFLWCRPKQVSQQAIGTKTTPFITLRLIEVRSKNTWHCYLTSVLDPTLLPPYVVVDLYQRRSSIEDAFNTGKRLLGLSYLWTGSLNGIQLQIWGTWLFYAVLADLGDSVADELALPFDQISLEMIYRGLYHFSVAHQKGQASDPVKYFASPDNQDLG